MSVKEWLTDTRGFTDRALKDMERDPVYGILFAGYASVRLPQAVNALEAVLYLHQSAEVEPSETICLECSDRILNGYRMSFVGYPCPTVRAITDALETSDQS